MAMADLFKRTLKEYRHNAKTRGLDFNLSDEEFHQLVVGDCHYCGAKPVKKIRQLDGKSVESDEAYSGIDRIDTKAGYDLSNCVSCCHRCNGIKFKDSQTETIDHILKMLGHLAKKGL